MLIIRVNGYAEGITELEAKKPRPLREIVNHKRK